MSGGTKQDMRKEKENKSMKRSQIRYEGTVGTVIYPELAEDLGYLEPP